MLVGFKYQPVSLSSLEKGGEVEGARAYGPAESVGLRPRAALLVGLLIFQSCSSFILTSYSELLQRHPVIVAFLTMLVGAGGNAGNQAAVLVIRGLALGEITPSTSRAYLWDEAKMSVKLALVLVSVGFVRVLLFQYPLADAVAISASLAAIVMCSIVAGACLPLVLQRAGFDPAHAGATIQVLMDLFGVAITCAVCSALLTERGHSQAGGVLVAAAQVAGADSAEVR